MFLSTYRLAILIRIIDSKKNKLFVQLSPLFKRERERERERVDDKYLNEFPKSDRLDCYSKSKPDNKGWIMVIVFFHLDMVILYYYPNMTMCFLY